MWPFSGHQALKCYYQKQNLARILYTFLQIDAMEYVFDKGWIWSIAWVRCAYLISLSFNTVKNKLLPSFYCLTPFFLIYDYGLIVGIAQYAVYFISIGNFFFNLTSNKIRFELSNQARDLFETLSNILTLRF